MKILFFIEPRIEMGRPYLRKFWLDNFTLDFIDTLNKSGMSGAFEYCIALNESLDEQAGDVPGTRKIIFTQKELYADFGKGALGLSTDWLNETYTEEMMSYYVSLMREKFTGFQPDIIITFTPCPFLRKAFPDALVMNHEVNMFSRAPYPMTLYIDPCGLMFGRKSFLNTFRSEIENTALDARRKELLGDFKKRCRMLLESKSPFNDIVLQLKNRFDHLALLPLGHSECCSFYSGRGSEFLNQYEFVQQVLEYLPENTGLIVTLHPDANNMLEAEAINYLKIKYRNFVFRDEFNDYLSSSQYILPSVDFVIGVYSSICFQALLWDKKVINLGTLDIIADASGLDAVKEASGKGNSDKDNILYWILTRYAVQRQYLYDPEWLTRFLLSSVEKFRSGGITFDFYEPIDSDENIFEALIAGLDENIPQHNGAMSYGRLKKAYDEIRSKDAFFSLDEMLKRGEVLFSEGRLNEAHDLFSQMLCGINRAKGELMNNIAVIHAHEGRLDKAESYLNYLIKEGYESGDAVKNLEMIREMKK